MKNLRLIKERYLNEPFDMRLGHLASDLARLSTFLENFANKTAVEDILEESKFFIEWTAPEAPFKVQALLSEMQSKLALWQYRLMRGKASSLEIEELKKVSKIWSEELIGASGFLAV